MHLPVKRLVAPLYQRPSAACWALVASNNLLFPNFSPRARGQQTLAQDDEIERNGSIESPLHPEKSRLPDVTFTPLKFSNAREVYQHKTTYDLLRSLLVFQTCRWRWLVNNADQILATANRVVGPTVVGALVRRTFFEQFCAGEDQESIQPTLRFLSAHGIGGILDYAAEDDVHHDAGPASRANEHVRSVVARTYDYANEHKCDAQMRVFKRSIEAAASGDRQGFSAVKVTALGDPQLLERTSSCILAIRKLFNRFDLDQTGYITVDEFATAYNEMFDNGKLELVHDLFHRLDVLHRDRVDYITFAEQMTLREFGELMTHCREAGPLSITALSDEELELVSALRERVRELAIHAAERNVRLMIDAEHTYFQPAIDQLCGELQREFNQVAPVVYNTYQCYLHTTRAQLLWDLERAKRHGYHVGVKLVRGAYMDLERKRAAQLGVSSPVFGTAQETHDNYNTCLSLVLDAVQYDNAELMLATHNQTSIERAIYEMHIRRMDPGTCGVYFGQLLGMADHLSFTLGRSQYAAYKYVPFGPIHEVMPYLIRRAQENGSIAAGTTLEMHLMASELQGRLLPFCTHSTAHAVHR